MMHPVTIFFLCAAIASIIVYLWLLFGLECTRTCCGKANTEVKANDEDQLQAATIPEEKTRQSTVLSQLENSNAENSDESSRDTLLNNEMINTDILDITDLVHESNRVTPITAVNKPDSEAETQTNSEEIQLVYEEMPETNTDQKQVLRNIISSTCDSVSQRQEHLEENGSFENLYSFLDEDLIAVDISNSSETSTIPKDLQENGKQLPTFDMCAPLSKRTHLTPIVSKEDLNDSYIMPEAEEMNEETSVDYGIYNDIDREHTLDSRAGNRKVDTLCQKQALNESRLWNWELINPVYESYIDRQGINESEENRYTLLNGNDIRGEDQMDTLTEDVTPMSGCFKRDSEGNQYSVLDEVFPDVPHHKSCETWIGLPSKEINRSDTNSSSMTIRPVTKMHGSTYMNITPSLPPKPRFSTLDGKLQSAKCQTKPTVSRKYHCYENVKFMNQQGNINTSRKKREDI